MNSLTPNRRAAYVEQPKKLSPTFYRTARACTINPAPHQRGRDHIGQGNTPHTLSAARAPRTDTPPPCGNGSKQTDEKLAGPVMLQGPKSRTVVETKY
ncbi:hypothetical protein HPB52_025168 [Rhipicephalus sanguineus]|uniref:Uncharacterized protein n=1 Tax=Rhipicephalus sanguineus TaxID=34632 RepID=A0A9D4TDC4_RHISA|nr:hypothetical protein HPB52_025168 [Rhipicephalus sanguineus]